MKLRTLFALSAAVMISVTCINHLGANQMLKIHFDIGRNIIETAKVSGAPRWSTRNIEGFISYKIMNLPPDIPLWYQRPGYEINILPARALTMYADKESNNDLAVETASIHFDTRALKSHAAAKTFVENLVLQFQNGKWARYIDDVCPAISGRSSFLNEAGVLDKNWSCPLDPTYRLSNDDWIQLMYMSKSYQWLGEGVLATLNIGYSDNSIGITYSIDLDFDDLAARNRTDEANRLRDLAEGDANGWKSTENEAKGIAERKLEIKVLEENARKRGDVVLPR